MSGDTQAPERVWLDRMDMRTPAPEGGFRFMWGTFKAGAADPAADTAYIRSDLVATMAEALRGLTEEARIIREVHPGAVRPHPVTVEVANAALALYDSLTRGGENGA